MTINWYEPFGLVMAEAMSCGTPVVGFDRGAVSELIVDGKTGFVVPPEKGVEGLKEALSKVDRIKPQDCRDHIVNNFSIEKMVENYEKTYKDVIEDFKDKVHEIIVLEGDFTSEQIKNGFDRATGDILVLVSPDGAFRSKDLPKLLEYMKDSDMVIGTRVTRQMIEQGANLRPFVRVANLMLGKMIDLLWWGQQPRFTDVDCRYFCVWKESYQRIRPQLLWRSRFPVVELMIEMVRRHMRCIEIPVSYHKTQEAVPYSFWRTCTQALSLAKVILKMKFESLL